MCSSDLEPQALEVEPLNRSPSRIWMASGHPLTERSELTLQECARHPLVVLEADRVEVLLHGLWAQRGLHPTVLIRSTSLEAVRSLVGVGAGIALLPDFLYRPWTLDAEHVEARELTDEIPTIDVGLVWRRGTPSRPLTNEFIELIREQSRSLRSRQLF